MYANVNMHVSNQTMNEKNLAPHTRCVTNKVHPVLLNMNYFSVNYISTINALKRIFLVMFDVISLYIILM